MTRTLPCSVALLSLAACAPAVDPGLPGIILFTDRPAKTPTFSPHAARLTAAPARP